MRKKLLTIIYDSSIEASMVELLDALELPATPAVQDQDRAEPDPGDQQCQIAQDLQELAHVDAALLTRSVASG